jgi:hypothetical protein
VIQSRPAAKAVFSWFPYVILMIVITILMGIPAILHGTSEWSICFVKAAHRLRVGESIYGTDGYVYLPYVYPPFSAFLALPFSFIPPPWSRFIWYLICVVCLCVMTKLSWDLSGGKTAAESAKSPARENAVFLLGCAVAIRFAFNAISHLQTDLLLDALLLLGLLALVQSRFALAGSYWGLSAAFKGPPLLLVLYLLWRRKFVAAFLMVAVTVGVNLLPNLVSAPSGGGLWLTQWVRSYAKPFGRDDTPGNWYNDIKNNQSIAGAVNRWVGTIPVHTSSKINAVPRHDGPSVLIMKILTMAGDLIVFLLLIVALFARDAARGSVSHSFVSRQVLECAMFFMLTLLLSPMASRTHFGIMILPAFCVARDAIYSRDRFSWALLLVALICSLVSINILRDKSFVEMTFWLGAPMFCALSLFVGCGYLILRPRITKTSQGMVPIPA